MRIYTTHRRIAKRLSANDSVKNVTMSKRERFPGLRMFAFVISRCDNLHLLERCRV